MKNILLSAVAVIAFGTGCAPVKVLDVVEIKPNETAWAIPMDGESKGGQVKFNSVAFLNEKKVASKRIMVDKVPRSVGRFWFDVEWIPAISVIRVDRSLVTREWTDNEKTGTTKKSEAIQVVTRDSVQLKVGLTITSSIEEEDASTYLYFHGNKSLADVTDTNIRSYCVAELTRQYSDLTLSEAQKQGNSIYSKLFDDSKKAFKDKGVTIQYLGNAEGLTYADVAVQKAINGSYTAQQDRQTAMMEQEATKIRNQTIILNAEAQAEAAQKTLTAKEASTLQTELKVRLLSAEAQNEMAKKWNGQLPSNILPAGSPLLLNLGNVK